MQTYTVLSASIAMPNQPTIARLQAADQVAAERAWAFTRNMSCVAYAYVCAGEVSLRDFHNGRGKWTKFHGR